MSMPGWDCHVHVFDGQRGSAAGHYAPPRRSLVELEGEAAGLGAGRFVLVQPSVYGSDNSVLLAALDAGRGQHRGVVVVGPSIEDTELQHMHAQGVRGVRFNLVSPVGSGPQAFEPMAPRLRALGWHVQWYARPDQLAAIAAWHARHGLACVLDHLGGFSPSLARDATLWGGLQALADQGAWIKLSGWYRLGASAPYQPLDDTIAAAAAMFGTRCVWGSDWPHTHFLEPGCEQPAPAYVQTWLPVLRALGAERAEHVLNHQPAELYG